MEDKITIYVATHKKAEFPKEKIYKPIRVGSALNKEDFGYQRDDIGENISNKNKNFCELTATYWIMKNDKSDIVGLTHYRRYFFKKHKNNKLENVLSEQDIKEILKENDIIVPNYTFIIKHNAEKSWEKTHIKKDYDECKKIISEKYPDYIETYDRYFNENKASLFNMLFCKREIFDAYCEWLFSILFVLEKQVDLAKLNTYQQRLYGFLSERLLNVWVIKNKLVVKHLPVIHMELPVFDRIRLVRRRFTNRFRFWIKRGSQR